MVERLDKEVNKKNSENVNLVDTNEKLSKDIAALNATNSKLETEYKTLQKNHEKLTAEHNKLANECKTLNRDIKVKSPSKRKVQPDKVSPRTVDIDMSGSCQPFSALYASAKEEDDDVASEDEYSGSENSCTSNNDECTDSDDSYPPSVSDDQDIDEFTHGYKAREFLTFYVGNLHYGANSYQVRKAVEKAISPCVDQVVIAKTSTGESRGCAFLTTLWKDYIQNLCDQNEFGVEELTRNVNKCAQQIFCRRIQRARICGRRVICEVARSQRRD